MISTKYKSQKAFQEAWRNGNAVSEITIGIEKSNLILSDLYLYEPHESDIWKNPDYIKEISGYKVFETVRNLKPAIPVIFHSSSNKIRNYKNLTSFMCDGYVVKDIRANSLSNDKLNTFTEFKVSISESINEFRHVWIHRLFNNLQNTTNTWWHKKIKAKFSKNQNLADETIQECIDLLKYILLAYKQMINQNYEFANKYYKGSVIDSYSFTVANIIQSCGRIDELMTKLQIHNSELAFLKNLRNQAAHSTNYHLYQNNDAKIAIVLLFKTLFEKLNRSITSETFTMPLSTERYNEHKYYHQLFAYTSYYNKFYNYIDSTILKLFEKRLRYYLSVYYTEKWKKYDHFEKQHIIDSYPDFQIDSSIVNPFEVDTKTINGKCTIKFKN